MPYSQLHTLQKNDNNNINTNKRYYCYRHKLDLKRNSMNSNESTMLENLQQMPTQEKQTIEQISSLFSKLSLKSRNIALEGLLHQCCSTQLSFLSNRLEDLNRIDFIAHLPEELSLHILSYLDATSLCHAAQVSKPWKLLADDDQRLAVERNWRKGMYNARVLKGHRDGVTCLQFNDEKNILISGSYDATVRIWDIEKGETVRILTGHLNCVKTLQFDDVKLITGSLDHTIKLWNYKTGQCIRTFCGHADGVNSIHFNERILASGSADWTVRVWDFTSCEHIDVQRCDGGVHENEDLPIIVSGSLDNTIKIWCFQTGKCCKTLFGHLEGVWTLALDRLRLVSGSQDNLVKIWDKDTGYDLHTLEGHSQPVTCVALSDTKIISGSDDKEIRIWDFKLFGEKKNVAASTAKAFTKLIPKRKPSK
ncbi:5980_t:CDS:2 [Entrophospora sp. SA101]|nr:5980_t:CDS:2 [Entrophospora sp. SA101]